MTEITADLAREFGAGMSGRPAHRPGWGPDCDSATAGGAACAADGEDWPCRAWKLEHPGWPQEDRRYAGSLTFDDALAAAEALAEIDAGHEHAAGVILGGAGLDELDSAELEALCRRFGTGP